MNYDSVNEIFSAGVTNMTCLLQESDLYDGGTLAVTGAEYLVFNGEVVNTIYAHGDTYWGIGKDIVSLRVDHRDARMRSLYREEGTLYGYYRFLKIRWEGWSYYGSGAIDYQMKYDLIFWETGDISLHMIQVPILAYDGTFDFTAEKNHVYTKPTIESPDVTFQYYKTPNIFEVKYHAIDFQVPFKLLIKDSEGAIYTIEKQEGPEGEEDTLVLLEDTELTSYLFKTRGFEKVPEWNLIKELDTPSVYSWSSTRAFPLNAIITGTPPKQFVECTADLSDGTVLGIKALNAEYTGEVTEQHSYDGGETFTEEIPMADFLTSDLMAMYEGLTDLMTITFRFWLSGDATLTTFVMDYRNGDDDDGNTDRKNKNRTY